MLIKFLGDAPRYLLPLPENIALRQAIRAAGVELVERLHRDGYDRIVILGHSLGSVIAYDIVTNAWIAMNTDHRSPHDTSFNASVALEKQLSEPSAVEEAQLLQHAAWEELRANTQPWLVTDLVTVGSPLTYADYLMADYRDEFDGLSGIACCPRARRRPRPRPRPAISASPTTAATRPRSAHGRDLPHVPSRGAVRRDPLDEPVLQERDVAGWPAMSSAVRSRRCSGRGSATSSSRAPRRWLAHNFVLAPGEAAGRAPRELRDALGLRMRPEPVTLLQAHPAYALIQGPAAPVGTSPERAPGPLAW